MRKIPHFLKKIPIFSSNWGSEIGSKYANFSDFWALLPDPETTSLNTDLLKGVFKVFFEDAYGLSNANLGDGAGKQLSGKNRTFPRSGI